MSNTSVLSRASAADLAPVVPASAHSDVDVEIGMLLRGDRASRFAILRPDDASEARTQAHLLLAGSVRDDASTPTGATGEFFRAARPDTSTADPSMPPPSSRDGWLAVAARLNRVTEIAGEEPEYAPIEGHVRRNTLLLLETLFGSHAEQLPDGFAADTFITTAGDGSVQVEWDRDGAIVEARILANGLFEIVQLPLDARSTGELIFATAPGDAGDAITSLLTRPL